jgi:hypothetical protein
MIDEIPSLHERAADNLHYIRSTIERAGSFTAVPGWGNVGIGVVGLLAAGAGARQTNVDLWLATWLSAASVSLGIGVYTMRRKAQRSGIALFSGPGGNSG